MYVYSGSDTLKTNKQRIVEAVKHQGGSAEDVLFALAMAMQESECCACVQRDASKDGTPSANFSCFNMNLDYLQMLGFTGTPDLNCETNLEEAVHYLLAGFQKWGRDSVLNFHRGGRTAWHDGVSYGAGKYREAIKNVVEYLRANPSKQTDATRVAFDVEHV